MSSPPSSAPAAISTLPTPIPLCIPSLARLLQWKKKSQLAKALLTFGGQSRMWRLQRSLLFLGKNHFYCLGWCQEEPFITQWAWARMPGVEARFFSFLPPSSHFPPPNPPIPKPLSLLPPLLAALFPGRLHVSPSCLQDLRQAFP